MSKDQLFQSQHLMVPIRGLALFINAFNFPSWGLWEKAAPALLSGVPVVVKPGTVTAWLTHQMVKDVVDAGILPPGALSIVCGSSAGLLDALTPFDVLSFTGSADTAASIRMHPSIARDSVRANIEADSLNVSILAEDAAPGTPAFDLFVENLARDMTIKSGQRCTAPRRALVPRGYLRPSARQSPASWRPSASATRATPRPPWARWSAVRSTTACARASRCSNRKRPSCSTAARNRCWMPTSARPASGRRCWPFGMQMRPPSFTTMKSSARCHH
jgi:hypothetical protein